MTNFCYFKDFSNSCGLHYNVKVVLLISHLLNNSCFFFKVLLHDFVGKTNTYFLTISRQSSILSHCFSSSYSVSSE